MQAVSRILDILSSPEILDWKVEKCRDGAGHMLSFRTSNPDIASPLNQLLILKLRSNPGMQPNIAGADYFPLIENQELADVLSNLRELLP